MNNSDHADLRGRLTAIYESVAAQLPPTDREEVGQLLGEAEIALACETLVLAMREEGIRLPREPARDLLDLCLAMNLDKAAVLRDDFWQLVGPFLESEAGTDATRPEPPCA